MITQALPPAELGLGDRPLPRISIFMSVFNCHVNRSPVAGRIDRIAYRPGVFINAELDKASEDNERNSLVISMPNGRIGVIQIAGLVARRIVSFVREGQSIGAGERFGLIRFGSRLDVYLPDGTKALGRRGPDRDCRRDRSGRFHGSTRLAARFRGLTIQRPIEPWPAAAMADGRGACYMSMASQRQAAYDALRSPGPRVAPPPVSPDPGADAVAQRHHAVGDLRRTDRDPAVHRRADGVGGRGDRVRRLPRRHRRPRRAHDQGAIEIRRRARQPRGFRQFRRGAGPDPVLLAVA